MRIKISIKGIPYKIKTNYVVLLEYQNKTITCIDGYFSLFLHTVHERIFEKLKIRLVWNFFGFKITSYYAPIRIIDLHNGLNYALMYPGNLEGYFIKYDHLSKNIGNLTFSCKITGSKTKDLEPLITEKEKDKLLKENKGDLKKYSFVLYQFYLLTEGTNNCHLDFMKGLYLLEKIFTDKVFLDNSRYKRDDYRRIDPLVAHKWHTLFYYAVAPYGKLFTIGIKPPYKVHTKGISSERRRVLEFLGIKNEDLFSIVLESSPAYLIFKKENILYVSIRGTETFKDVVYDVYTKFASYENGFIHEGINELAHNFFNQHKEKIPYLMKEKNCKEVIFLGHSLGGSLAIMLGLLFRKILPLKVFAFSPPPFMSSSITKNTNCDFITSIVNGDDLFPRFSIGTILELKYICISLAGNEKLIKRNNLDELIAYYKEIKAHVRRKRKEKKLRIPGKIFHIKKFPLNEKYLKGTEILKRTYFKDFDAEILVKEVEWKFFNELVITGGWYPDHVLVNFLKNLGKAYENE